MRLISFLDYAYNRRLTGFHVGSAARTLSVDKRTVYRWINKSGINGLGIRFAQHIDPNDRRRTLFYMTGRPDFLGDRDRLCERISELETINIELSCRLNSILELSRG